MTKPLASQIFPTGTKFVVTDETKDTTFGPGTTGFVSYVKGRDQDFANVLHYRIVTIKRGKGGKERIELNDISTPVFELEGEKFHEMMPDAKRRYYVPISPEPLPATVLEMSDLDFLAYGFAYARWVRKLNTRSKHVNAWPNSTEDLLNVFVRMDDYFTEDPDLAKERYAAEPVRDQITRRMRIMESTLVKCSLSYMTKIAEIETGAVHNILSANLGIVDKKQLKFTLDSYTDKAKSLKFLADAHSPKVKSSKGTMETLAAGLSWS
jgi:hypothetical protein